MAKGKSITLSPDSVELLKKIAPEVGADPKQPFDVIRKAVKLLDFVKGRKVVVTDDTGSYKVNIENF